MTRRPPAKSRLKTIRSRIALGSDERDKTRIEKREVTARVCRYGAKSIARPILGILANVLSIALELIVIGNDHLPKIGLPKPVDAEIGYLVRLLHFTVDGCRKCFELTNEFAEMVFVVSRAIFAQTRRLSQ